MEQPRLEDAETIRDGLDGGARPEPMPERIGPYRIDGRLGSGGMGEVFLAWDDCLKRQVAIKRIRPDSGLTAMQRDRFRREACLAARLSHSAVVQVHHIVSEGSDDAIVMEYVEGHTLADLLRERLEMPEILRLAREIAEGLAAAHDEGLIHRDLKTANVIVTGAGHAKILDFGLARPVDRPADDPSVTRQGIILGTCYAMSPEQARGEEVDQRSDLFSFGSLVHEMLTGLAPFRGTAPVDSLRRVLTEEPVDPLRARPDLPAEAACLLRRLLQKDRNNRPTSAHEVVEVLERLRSWPSVSPAVAPQAMASEQLTEASTTLELPAPFHRDSAAASPEKPLVWTRRRIFLTGVATVLLLAGAVGLYLTIRSPQPLRIAVIHPEISTEEEDLAAAATRVHTAVVQALTKIQGIKPLDPNGMTDFRGTPVKVGQAVGADQVLMLDVKREGGTALVTLKRLEVPHGGMLGLLSFSVALGREKRPMLADTVRAQVQKLFPDNALVPSPREFDVRERDLDTFLDIQERVDMGEVHREDLDQLEALMSTSPAFLDAPVLAARIAHSLFLSKRDPADLDRALAFVGQAMQMAPEDSRTLRQAVQIALTGNRIPQAETFLERLERLEPGDPDVLPLRADLAEQKGDFEEAAALQREAVEQVPSWQNKYRLADLEAQRGRIDAAREQIEAILAQSPDNLWAQEALGNLELNYGDLPRAEEIYRKLVNSVPARAYGNLATIRALSDHFQEAEVFYRKALDAQPEHAPALINLAEVEKELGHEREAEDLYRRALERLQESEADASLTPVGSLLKAQCLARLGQTREAVAIAREQLDKNPDDAALRFQITLIYSLAGERASAIEHAKAALARGIQPRWFTGSPLRWLRGVKELSSWFQEAR